MSTLRLYSVSDRYISYLRQDKRLQNVFDNKAEIRTHTRKYLGVVFSNGDYDYFVPFSSPKESDYIIKADGTKEIRKSIIPIVRMVTKDTVSGQPELKGTLKLNNMIPVPESELTPYDIAQESDVNYRQIVRKEWQFIRSNRGKILKNAQVIYRQKTNYATLYATHPAPGYLSNTIDFQYAEERCNAFVAALKTKQT